MKILAFDTSTKFLSIACLSGGDVRSEFHEDVGIRHSEILVPTIKDELGSAGWAIKDVDLIAVGLGPGSFTGLRIAVATVKGFAAMLGTGVVGVPTMDAIVMNLGCGKSSPVKYAAPLLDARKGKVYTCIYRMTGPVPERVTEYMLAEAGEVMEKLEEEVLFFGDAVDKYRETLDRCRKARYDECLDWYPRAADIGRIGLGTSSKSLHDPETLEPLYLHSRECNITQKNT